MATYVIAGATGHVGSVAAKELLSRNQSVKIIVRDAAKASDLQNSGASIAAGSLDKADFLSQALAGADGAFLMLPPDNRKKGEGFNSAQRRTAESIAAGVSDSRIPYVVLLSSIGADLEKGTGPIQFLHFFENKLRETGTKLAIIRAGSFQENIAAVVPAAVHAGIYPSFLPSLDASVPMIATRDIGHLAAELLLSPPENSEVIDLLGPAYSARDLCQKLSAALGKQLQLIDVPPERHVDTLVQAGIDREMAEIFAEMYAAIASGKLLPKGDRRATGDTSIDEVIPGLLPARTSA